MQSVVDSDSWLVLEVAEVHALLLEHFLAVLVVHSQDTLDKLDMLGIVVNIGPDR